MGPIVPKKNRLATLDQWLHDIRPNAAQHSTLVAIPHDASFRRYYRTQTAEHRYVVMDAPPEQESHTEQFVKLAKRWLALGLPVPEVYQYDLAQGFVLMRDVGEHTLLSQLNQHTVDRLYPQALTILHRMHQAVPPRAPALAIPEADLPPYNAARLQGELALFADWFLGKLLGWQLSTAEHTLCQNLFTELVRNAEQQPQGLTHRDFHSRNIIVDGEQNLCMVDFQDAVWGPITYDVVSLLKGAYVNWPTAQVNRWSLDYLHTLQAEPSTAKILDKTTDALWLQWFDLMGLQRHLKIVGIFSRLALRDQRPEYLGALPRLLNDIFSVCRQYACGQAFYNFLQQRQLDEQLAEYRHDIGRRPRQSHADTDSAVSETVT